MQVVLSHTSPAELDEFWGLFEKSEHFRHASEAAERDCGTLGDLFAEQAGDIDFSNPMMMNPMMKGVKGGVVAKSATAAGGREQQGAVL